MLDRRIPLFALLVLPFQPALTVPLTFEDLSFAAGDFENGANLTGTTTTTNDPFGPGTGSLLTKDSVFTTGVGNSGSFANTFSEKYDAPDGGGSLEYTSWSGWAYSRTTDTTTPGFGNQYSAIAGSGAGGSSVYGVSYTDTSVVFNESFDFAGRGIFVTNTTYAYYSMLNGDTFAKQFGGATGTDEDFFTLTVEGYLEGGSTGTVDFFLADYRSANPGDDYIVSDWRFVNLGSLGVVDTLMFNLSSSDNGIFGMNTPDYFAIDNIGAIPEPSTTVLWALIACFLLSRRRNLRTG